MSDRRQADPDVPDGVGVSLVPPFTLSYGGVADRASFGDLRDAVLHGIAANRRHTVAVLIRDSAPRGCQVKLLIATGGTQ